MSSDITPVQMGGCCICGTSTLLMLAATGVLCAGFFFAAVYANKGIAMNHNRLHHFQTALGRKYMIGCLVAGTVGGFLLAKVAACGCCCLALGGDDGGSVPSSMNGRARRRT